MVTKRRLSRGVGLVEILVGLVITGLLLAGVVRFLTGTSKKTSKLVRETKLTLQARKLLVRMVPEITNIVVIPDFASITVLANQKPVANCGGDDVASSLIPLPGFSRADLDSETVLTVHDPSNPDLIDETSGGPKNDAIRFVHFLVESEPLFLAGATSPVGSQVKTKANENIVLQWPSKNHGKLNVGDFILISDTSSSDLSRITAFGTQTSTTLELVRSPTVSTWNLNVTAPASTHVYGASGSGDVRAFVHKVGIRTYALDSTEQILYMDTHHKDDGFIPETGIFATPVSLAHAWTPVLTDLSQFRVHYRVVDPDDPTDLDPDELTTRTPRSGFLGDANTFDESGVLEKACGNQLGSPYLQRILIETKDVDGLSRSEINPENLRRGIVAGSGGDDLRTDPVFIQGVTPTGVPPTPTFGGWGGSGGGIGGGGGN